MDTLARIASLVHAKGWTIAGFLRHAGLNKNMFNDWKHGKSSPEKHLPAIARALGTTEAYLRGETDDPAGETMGGFIRTLAASASVPLHEWPDEKKRELLRYVKYLDSLEDDW